VPGYVELELETADGMYHSWAFEVGWVVDDVFEPDEEVLASVGQAFDAAGESLPPPDANGDGVPDQEGVPIAAREGSRESGASGGASPLESGLRTRGSTQAGGSGN